MEGSGTVIAAALAGLWAFDADAVEPVTGTVAETGVRCWNLRDNPLELKLQQLIQSLQCAGESASR